MKLAEAWRLSNFPYKEGVYRSLAEERGRMWWGAFGRNLAGKEDQDDLELTKRALRIAKFDKLIVAIFNVIVSIVPFASLILGSSLVGLASSISLSLAVTFGFLTLYAIQTLSSFVSAESSALLSTLPIERDDFSLITVFSFVRSVDYIVVGSIASQALMVAYLTASPMATLFMLAASTMNALFAVTIALWFSRMFQKNLMRAGRSKANTALRLFFILMWGVLLVGVGFLFSIPSYIMPNLENTLLGIGPLSNLLLCLIYPFSVGTAMTNLVSSSVTHVAALVASAAMVAYTMLAVIAGRWSLTTIKRISQGAGVKVARVTAKDFSIKTRRPLLGYAIKDLRVASRNPATAFFFAFPVLETVIIAFLVSNVAMLRTSAILVATSMGGVFTLFLPLALLSAEGRGLEYTKTLPVSSRRIIISKALLSTATFVPVPLVLVVLALVKPLTSLPTILIPFIMIAAIASASIFEIKLFLNAAAKGKIAAMVNDMEKLVIGVLTVLIPEAAYAGTFLFSLDHGISLLALGATTLAELAVAAHLLRHS